MSMRGRMIQQQQQQSREVNRKRVIAVALAACLDDTDEEYHLLYQRKCRREHAFWMSPYLHARTDASQRNTLAKLEADFLRVSTNRIANKK